MVGIWNNREFDFILNVVYGGIYEDGFYKVEIVNVSDVNVCLCCFFSSKSWVVVVVDVVDNEIVVFKLLIVVLLMEEGEYLVV